MTTAKMPPPSKHVVELQAAMQDLAERLRVERLKDRQRVELREFLAHRLLSRKDVLDVVASLPKRAQRTGDRPVASANGKGKGHAMLPPVGKIGKAIRRGRMKKSLSTTAVGEKIGMSAGAISAYELGKAKPSQETADKLTKLLGVTVPARPNGHAAAAE